MDHPLPAAPLPAAERPAAISRHLVRTLSFYTGRGPETVRSHVSDGVVTVVVMNSLVKAEQSLVEAGHSDEVLQARRAVQSTMKANLIEGVEAITGQRVLAFLSDHDVEVDISVETFVLEPSDEL